MTKPKTTEPETTELRTEALESAALERAESEAAAEAAAVAPPQVDAGPEAEVAALAAPAPDALDRTGGIDDPLTTNDYTVAFSPRQVAVGLAIVAGLVAVVAARRRRGKRTDRTD